MIKLNSIFKSGVNVEGYSIPVLNEREIRAVAGMVRNQVPEYVRLFNADFSKKPHDLFGTSMISI